MKTKNLTPAKKIRITMSFFIIVLALSGITAIPVKTEINWLLNVIPRNWETITAWLQTIAAHLEQAGEPLMYGYDWLAFAHIVIAICFIGVLKDPVRNIWVVEFGMISCVLIIPFALLMGPERGIPFWWQLIDCSFGVLGIIPLYLVRKWTLQMETTAKPYII